MHASFHIFNFKSVLAEQIRILMEILKKKKKIDMKCVTDLLVDKDLVIFRTHKTFGCLKCNLKY